MHVKVFQSSARSVHSLDAPFQATSVRRISKSTSRRHPSLHHRAFTNFPQHMSNEQGNTVAVRAPNGHPQGHAEPGERISNDPSMCVICLESIFDKAAALPCAHADFDFACLGAWIQRNPSCPLCKAAVCGIEYHFEKSGGPKVFLLPLPDHEVAPLRRDPGGDTSGRRLRIRDRGFNARSQDASGQHNGLERRRQVYEERSYSLHVGSNGLSGYRNINPQAFQQNAVLARRAKIWVRRELQVFEFLNSPSAPDEQSTRRARNAEFLGAYVLAILRTIDIRGSTGQAEEMLQEFVGRDNARLFLHELESWLRSPYEQLRDWDEAVQYVNHTLPSRNHGGGISVHRNRA